LESVRLLCIDLYFSFVWFVCVTNSLVGVRNPLNVGNVMHSNTTISLKVYLMAILDNYMFRLLLAIFMLA